MKEKKSSHDLLSEATLSTLARVLEVKVLDEILLAMRAVVTMMILLVTSFLGWSWGRAARMCAMLRSGLMMDGSGGFSSASVVSGDGLFLVCTSGNRRLRASVVSGGRLVASGGAMSCCWL